MDSGSKNGHAAMVPPTEVWIIARRVQFANDSHVDFPIRCCGDEESAKAGIRAANLELQAFGQSVVLISGKKLPLSDALMGLGIVSVGHVTTKMQVEGMLLRPQSPLIIASS